MREADNSIIHPGESYTMERQVVQAIEAIAANHTAGATELAEQAAEAFLRCAQMDKSTRIDSFRQKVLSVGWALIRAQPTMAPLVNLVNNVLWAIDPLSSLTALRQTIYEVASTFKHRLHVHEAAIAESVLPLIPDKAQVVTLSRSTTVKAALRHAQHAGRRFRVVCAEGRPGLEGHLMAGELSEYSIPVTVVVDALAISMVSQSQLVLVGGDHLRGNDLVNKIGTYALALAAQDHGIPIYALCSSDKFLPPGYTPPPQMNWPPEQIWSSAPASVTVQNTYFDHTPLSHISGIVTEKGVLPSEGIEAWLAAIKIHPLINQSSFGF